MRRIGVFAPFSSFGSFNERLNGVLATTTGAAVEVVVFDVESAAESAGVLESLPSLHSLDESPAQSRHCEERAGLGPDWRLGRRVVDPG